MQHFIFILLCCLFLSSAVDIERKEKTFSLFSVLKWQNAGCQAVSDTALQGVCYTKQECDDLGGTADGNCAAGFGTCCVVSVRGTAASPGGTVTQNCSYIENIDYPAADTANAATYTYMIMKCSSDICQIRLDFITGNFAQPVAATGQCATRDTVTVTPGGGEAIPVVCGDISTQHMYFDAGSTNAAGTLQIVTTANMAGGTKNWRVKVSQIECSSATRAPNGCLQYFLENTNTVQTFNWDGATGRAGNDGGILAAQDYRACIRQNAGMCSIQWTESPVADTLDAFDFHAVKDANKDNSQHTQFQCSEGMNGIAMTPSSFVTIPGATISNRPTLDIFCGSKLSNFVTTTWMEDGAGDGAGALKSGAVIATGVPFEIRFVSRGDQDPEAGASLVATQIPCGINPTGINDAEL